MYDNFYFACADETNPSTSDPVGMLTSTGAKSGFLGTVEQTSYVVRMRDYEYMCTLRPIFDVYNSSKYLDDVLYDLAIEALNGRYYNNSDIAKTVTFKHIKVNDLKLHYDVQGKSGFNGRTINPVRWGRMMSFVHNMFLWSLTNSSAVIYNSNARTFITRQTAGFLSFFADTLIITLFPISLSFMIPVFMSNVIEERERGILEYIKTFGVTSLEYEFVRLVFDYMNYFIMLLIVCIVGLAFQFRFIWLANPAWYIPILLLWGFTQIGFSYFLSMFFSSTKWATVAGYLISLGSSIVAAIVNIIALDSSLAPWYFYIYPPFAFSRAIAVLIIQYKPEEYPIGQYDIAISFVYLLVETIVLFILASKIWIDIPKWLFFKVYYKIKDYQIRNQNISEMRPIKNYASEDEDVLKEKERVMKGEYSSNSIVVIKNLTKVFNPWSKMRKIAVDGMCLSLQSEEVFALLGENGAGKTTLIKMLSGFESPTAGTATIGGYDIVRNMKSVRRLIGICPQFDIFWDNLTVREHLLFFARLRGIPITKEYKHVEDIISMVGLEDARRRYASQLSGGMKRRLSIATSLIGNPAVVFLDEPTSGLDPVSRRGVWDVINTAKKNRSIVLTTHMMDEAEALAQRIGIMISGRLHCLGTLLHLKQKFGEGYKVVVQCDPAHAPKVQEFMLKTLPNSYIEDQYAGTMFFRSTAKNLQLSQFFQQMNKMAPVVGIKDWSLNQASLEEVFLKMASEKNIDQMPNDEPKPTIETV